MKFWTVSFFGCVVVAQDGNPRCTPNGENSGAGQCTSFISSGNNSNPPYSGCGPTGETAADCFACGTKNTACITATDGAGACADNSIIQQAQRRLDRKSRRLQEAEGGSCVPVTSCEQVANDNCTTSSIDGNFDQAASGLFCAVYSSSGNPKKCHSCAEYAWNAYGASYTGTANAAVKDGTTAPSECKAAYTTIWANVIDFNDNSTTINASDFNTNMVAAGLLLTAQVSNSRGSLKTVLDAAAGFINDSTADTCKALIAVLNEIPKFDKDNMTYAGVALNRDYGLAAMIYYVIQNGFDQSQCASTSDEPLTAAYMNASGLTAWPQYPHKSFANAVGVLAVFISMLM